MGDKKYHSRNFSASLSLYSVCTACTWKMLLLFNSVGMLFVKDNATNCQANVNYAEKWLSQHFEAIKYDEVKTCHEQSSFTNDCLFISNIGISLTL